MKNLLSLFRRARLPLVMAALGVVAMAASADCVLHSVRSHDAAAPVGLEARGEAGVPMGDPALDGLFARYADLHRDAVGYAVADVVGSSMVAKGTAEGRMPITR